MKKNSKKFGGLKKVRIFAARLRENGFEKFIEKIEGKYKKQVPRKYNLSRSVNSFERIRSVSDKLEIYKKLYNEEFDPGSG